MHNSQLIQAVNISKVYYDLDVEVSILKDVCLDVKKGETTAIVGKSGSGKSTCLNILAGLDVPTGGEVLFKGEDINTYGEERRNKFRNQDIGFIYQNHYLLRGFSALENICMPLLIRGEQFESAKEKAIVLLEGVGLLHRSNHKPSELSGGERQRVAVCRALITTPEIIFADEPTGNLDHKTSSILIDTLLSLIEIHETALLLVTHDLNLSAKMNHVYQMSDGAFINR